MSLFKDYNFPKAIKEHHLVGNLRGSLPAQFLATLAEESDHLVIALCNDIQQMQQLELETRFFITKPNLTIEVMNDWETLAYDIFSPLPELVSQRLTLLSKLQNMKSGIVILAIPTLMQRLCPPSFIKRELFDISVGDKLDVIEFRARLEQSGYTNVPQVFEHGEFCIRGSLMDLFPLGANQPYRIDLFDDEIESIRTFNQETQRTIAKVKSIKILPAREFPTNQTAITNFRKRYRQRFDQDPNASLIYCEISQNRFPGGIEYYFPLFFDHIASFFDYLPQDVLYFHHHEYRDVLADLYNNLTERYEQRRHDNQRPLLTPEELFLKPEEVINKIKQQPTLSWLANEVENKPRGYAKLTNINSTLLPQIIINARAKRPAALLERFLQQHKGRILFTTESAGRREHLVEILNGFNIKPSLCDGWQDFLTRDDQLCLTIAPIQQSGIYDTTAIISESALLGQRISQQRKAKRRLDANQIIYNLTELHQGAPVVHEEHGIGRFLGLQIIDAGGRVQEFLTLGYAGGDKLYIPVASLHLISRYTGADPDNAPFHKLGTDQWAKAKSRAAKKAYDVAAELLDIYARRKAAQGFVFELPNDEYLSFSQSFEFVETEDQQAAIDAIMNDMQGMRPMDRVVCGDVGFGKTEVAMRATFIAAINGKQVAILAPTTLLSQQHLSNFEDRFADWPVRLSGLSRFNSLKDQKAVKKGLAEGAIDIVIGTHALLGKDVKFKNLGLVIIDEEHRFGVRHKERLQSLRAQVDILTLTATPIPRTLNMALSGMRDLSIISTPPVARHPIKTFISQWNDVLIKEAIHRETNRGGQVYFLHNEIKTITNIAARLRELIPESRIEIAHGQMRERELEQIMRDFYRHRFQILLSTTIIESGIDVPTANTIIINRADKLGLSQLHQLRGRVGRSHHRAYAYLLRPPQSAMSTQARKRLEAIESLEDLGAGFTLATHDLEIRGAGELLGDEQSGQINQVGYSLYNDLLERAVTALKTGQMPQLERPLEQGTEVDLGTSALIPDDYLPDVHTRLIQYKRLANAQTPDEIRELQVEMIDRFGLFPQPLKTLIAITRLKLRLREMGIQKLTMGDAGGLIYFNEKPKIDFDKMLLLIQNQPQQFRLESQNRLRFSGDYTKEKDRIDKVQKLLNMIQ